MAPAWHTALLVAVCVAAGFTSSAGAPSSSTSAALAQILIEASLVGYLAAGMYLRGRSLRDLLGQAKRLDLLWAALVAVALLSAWLLAQRLWPGFAPAAASPLPATIAERALWIGVAAVIACAEELVFRGYLQRQFESAGLPFALAALAQAAVFAAAHANQGARTAVGIGLAGLALALLARARKGLLAPIAAHFLLDACAAFWP